MKTTYISACTNKHGVYVTPALRQEMKERGGVVQTIAKIYK